MKYHLLFIFCTVSILLNAQQTEKYSNYINVEDLKTHISTLASDDYLGRETGKEGQKMAARYIKQVYNELGVLPGNDTSFQQFFSIAQVTLGGFIVIGQDSLFYGDDFIPMFFDFDLHKKFSKVEYISGCDIKKSDIEEQSLVIVDLANDCELSISDVYKKADNRNAEALLVINNKFNALQEDIEYFHGNASLIKDTTFTIDRKNKTPLIVVSPEHRTRLKQVDKNSVELNVNSISILEGSNLPAIIEGSDPKLKNEYVVITAHYDHLGASDEVVFNGADDNGTGTAALLEIAEAFKKAKEEGNGPKRSILIMPVSGEEKGLLGSDYYVNNPTIPLSDIVADLNIDMIGRVDEHHTDEPNYIYLIGSDRLSKDLHNISEKVNEETTKFTIDYTYNEKDDPNQYYYRSDHYNFAKNKIPSIFYFSGVHADYHQPTDTVDKIDFERVKKVTLLVYYTACELANRKQRPQLD